MSKFVIAGLGNPGKEYKFTRHNIGFALVEYLAEKNSIQKFYIWKDFVEYALTEISGYEVYLVKPIRYMNNSGEALKPFCSFNNISVENILVCYDDVALPFGKIRIRKKGSDGGHNGMKSIINNFGTQEIKRLRIGIKNEENFMELKDFVLSKFSEQELKIIPSILKNCEMAITEILKNGIDSAMNKFNL